MWSQVTELRKAWVCLFTCFTVRAIHLECVLDLTATQFLRCLRWFVTCIGILDSIISDNAPLFKLIKTALNIQWRQVCKHKDVLNYVSMESIKWNVTIVLAPWQYEKLVGMVKQSLWKAMGRKHFTLDQLITLLTEIEAVINSRFLMYVCLCRIWVGTYTNIITLLVSNRKFGIFSSSDTDYYHDADFIPMRT